MRKIDQRLEANPIRIMPDDPFPHADTPAALALKSALAKMKEDKKSSLRSIAKLLNYKQAAVLSHMASGRIPIPVQRAEEIATVLDINPSSFVTMVLKQRFRNTPISVKDDVIDHFGLLSQLNQPSLPHGLNNATPSQMRIIREVLRDDHASERWLSPHEVFHVNLIRQLRPDVITDGLSTDDLRELRIALAQVDNQLQSEN